MVTTRFTSSRSCAVGIVGQSIFSRNVVHAVDKAAIKDARRSDRRPADQDGEAGVGERVREEYDRGEERKVTTLCTGKLPAALHTFLHLCGHRWPVEVGGDGGMRGWEESPLRYPADTLYSQAPVGQPCT